MAAANGARGEVEVVLSGERRRVCLTLGALAEIETGLGVAGLAAVAERMRALSASLKPMAPALARLSANVASPSCSPAYSNAATRNGPSSTPK